MNEKINNLKKKYPLSSDWSELELFNDEVMIGELSLEMIGFSTQKNEKMMVTGSSAACTPFNENLLERAYFELLERSVVIEKTFDYKNGETFCYSKSNGVAIHTDFELAKKAAQNELIERDAILRSWFLNQSPLRVLNLSPEIQILVKKLGEYYDFEFYTFNSSLSFATNSFVTASFAFPKKDNINFCYGLSCRGSLEESLKKSFAENLQTLAFLWGEGFDEVPLFSPSPSYHQHYFSTKNGLKLIRDWLYKKNVQSQKSVQIIPDFTFEDLTPEHLKGKAYVIRATEKNAIPLIFGKGYNLESCPVENDRYIHPIC